MEKRLVTANVCVMTDSQRYFGRIIFPEQDHTLNDVWLTIDGNKIFVELPDPELGIEDWGVIWGEFNKLGTVSLLDCGLGSQMNGFGGNQRKLLVHKLIQGHKLISVNDKFIQSIKMSCPTLNDWFFVPEYIEFDKNHIKVPETNKLFKINCLNFKLDFIISYGGTHSFKEINLKRGLSINATFNCLIDIREFYVWKKRLEKLIIFLTNEDPKLEITSLNNTHHKIFGIDSIWQANRFTYGIEIDHSIVSKNIPAIFQNWFQKEKLIPITELLQEKKSNPDLSIPRYFFNLCVATESIHRDFIEKNVEIIDKSIIERREKIKELIAHDEELFYWFRAKSSFWKKPELYDRLINLKDELSEIVGDSFGIPTEDLLKMIKNTRNKLAHEGKHNTQFKTEFSLFLAGYTLEMLLQYQVLKILGIDDDPTLNKFLGKARENVETLARINNYSGLNNEIEG
jgi:hypothetical protein